MRPSSQMRRRSPCKREKTRLDSVGRAPHSITPRPVDPALRLRTAATDVRFINEVPTFRRLAEQRLQRSVKPSSPRHPWCESKSADQIRGGSGRMARLRSSKPMTRVRFSRPAPLDSQGRSSTAEPRSPKPMMGMQLSSALANTDPWRNGSAAVS